MKRTAILIEASNVLGEKELPGAKKDVENWTAFLASHLGGFWDKSEILTFNKPNTQQIKTLLAHQKDGYCFVIFSGHGQDGSVVLNETERKVSYQDLYPRGTKGTLIIDACRGLPEEKITVVASALNSGYFAGRSVPMSVMVNEQADDILAHRKIWLNALDRHPTGIVTMISCAKGQSADEDANAGGYYTSLLMTGAHKWEKDDKIQQEIFTTLEAHDYAVKNLPPQQTPEYRPNRNTSFPFAAKLTSHVGGLLEKAVHLQQGKAGTSPRGIIYAVGPSFPLPNPPHRFYG